MSSTPDYKLSREARPGLMEGLAHYFQILMLTHSCCNIFAWILKPFINLWTFYQSVRANQGAYLYRKRRIHGENFVCAGGVWMCGVNDVKTRLLEEQARTFLLAPTKMDPDHLPMLREGGRLNLLISMSQKGAGGSGDYEAFRAALVENIMGTEDLMLRAKDATAQKLLDKLVEEYKSTSETVFFTDNERGLLDFLNRYLHYVILNIDPEDNEKVKIINDFHYDDSSAAWHLKVLGNCLQCVRNRKWPAQFKQLTRLYAESPVLSAFEGQQSKYNNMTRYELAGAMLSMMCLAGMVGPRTLAYICLGRTGLPPYDSKQTHKIDVKQFWDKLDLDDRDEVLKFVYECGRLRNPVSNTHHVAQEDFVARIGKRDITFKKGTVIFIPLIMVGLNDKLFGPTTFEFDHKREGLCPFATMFHSWGEQTNGRICPGKKLVEVLLVDMLIALGKYRQSKGAQASAQTH